MCPYTFIFDFQHVPLLVVQNSGDEKRISLYNSEQVQFLVLFSCFKIPDVYKIILIHIFVAAIPMVAVGGQGVRAHLFPYCASSKGFMLIKMLIAM